MEGLENGIGFFEEKSGIKSLTRLISFILVCVGCLIALVEINYCMFGDSTYEIHTGLIDSLVISGLGGKVLQKVFGEVSKK